VEVPVPELDREDALARRWVDRETVVGIGARGRRVWTVVARPSADGSRYLHRVVECTPGRPEVDLTPSEVDCTEPVLLSDGSLLVRTDGGDPDEPRQVAERAPTGEWRTWTDSPGGVVAFAAAESALVVLEKMQAADTDWRAPVVAVASGPARFWRDWLTESDYQLVYIDRRTGVRRPLGVHGRRSLSQCSLALSPDGARLAHTPLRVAEDGVLQRGLEVRTLPGRHGLRTVWGPPNSDHTHPVFSPDGSQLAFVRHTRRATGHGRRQLHVLDLITGASHAVAPSWPGWLEPHAWTDDHGILCLATVDGQRGVFALRPTDAEPRRVDAATGSWDAVAVGQQVWGLASRLNQRPSLQPVEAVGAAPVTQPWSATPPCPTLFWPASSREPRPLVLMAHGGPVYSWTDSWHPRQSAAFFHELGCHVLLPNPAGSTGHGDAHVDAIWHDWDACTDQLVALLHQAAARPDVSRLILFGGSFGGWAVNRLATRTDVPALGGVITHAGIFDHHSMWSECDEPAAFSWHIGPSPHHRAKADPARFVEHWHTPTLILHGAKDYNVPVGQALALHHALERQGTEHRLVVFPEEGHHILSPRGKVRWWREVAEFVRDVLGPETRTGGPTARADVAAGQR
jgi:alpha-beta hydrolase superfamily lysophospholipase